MLGDIRYHKVTHNLRVNIVFIFIFIFIVRNVDDAITGSITFQWIAWFALLILIH